MKTLSLLLFFGSVIFLIGATQPKAECLSCRRTIALYSTGKFYWHLTPGTKLPCTMSGKVYDKPIVTLPDTNWVVTSEASTNESVDPSPLTQEELERIKHSRVLLPADMDGKSKTNWWKKKLR